MSKNAGVTGYGEDFWHVLLKLQKREGKNKIWKRRIFAYTDARMMRWGYI